VPLQFDRKYSLEITSGSETKIITDLRVNFNIEKSLHSYPNLAEISIYNPNDETVSMLRDRFSKIVFNAGYKGNLRLIFKGDVRNVFDPKQGVDRIATIFAGDGERDWQNSTFNKTLSANIAIKQVITEIATTFKETILGVLGGVDNEPDKLEGQTLSGSSKDILNMLGEDYGFQWSIQDGILTTVPDDDILKDKEVVLINPNTGMIGSPTITELGVNVVTLLNPDLLPNRGFKVESAGAEIGIANLQFREIKRTKAEGVYKAYRVVFNGDTHGPNWFSTVEGRVINVG